MRPARLCSSERPGFRRPAPSARRGAGAAVALLLGLALTGACGSEASRRPPSVLLISIDSLRRDRLGCYGHRPEFAPAERISPNLDALAARGVVFDSAWSSSSWTLPAHMSLLTGLSTAGHGVETDRERLDPLRTTVAQRFQAAGWATAGIYSGPYLDPRYGFERGFDSYESAMLSPQRVDELIERERARRAEAGAPAPTAAEERNFRARVSTWDVTSARATERAARFLREHAEQPFFLFLHYFDVHYDYTSNPQSEGLARRLDPDYQGPFDGHNWYFDERVRELEPPFARRIGERDLQHVRALYDAEIAWVDQHVGRVLDALDQLGLSERTIVAVVSDHGDEFFEHGDIAHRNTLFQEVTGIPMILALPGGEHAGQRVAAPARIYDLASTLLDYAGAPGLVESDGASLRGQLDGTESSSRSALSRLYDPTPWFLNLRESWRDERYSVIRHFVQAGESYRQVHDPASGEAIFHVYDRGVDPGERDALRPGEPRYREAVDLYRRAYAQAQAQLAGLRRSPLEECSAPDVDSARRAQLAQLGYASPELQGRPVRVRLVLPPPW